MPSTELSSPHVVAVIPAYNSAAYIERAMRSLRSQDYSPLTCLVIDDSSTDGTYDVALKASAALGGVTVLRNEENRGFAATLNRALGLCRDGDLLFVHQDDIELLDETYLSRAVEWFRDPTIALVTGQSHPRTGRGIPLVKRIFSRLLCLDYEESRPATITYSLLKADTVRVDVLHKVGGFRFIVTKKLGLEDKLLGSSLDRAGYRLIKDPRLKFALGFARTERTWAFLMKEWSAGRQLGYAVLLGAISARPADGESIMRRNHRFCQVAFGSSIPTLLILTLVIHEIGVYVTLALLLVRVLMYLGRSNGFGGIEKISLIFTGLATDLFFAVGFLVGVHPALLKRITHTTRLDEA